MAEEKKAGRPPKYDDPDVLQGKIDEYIKDCEERKAPMTFTGLAFFLGFNSRTSLWEYSKKDGPISEPVKRAMLRIEQSYEENLYTSHPTGSIFALKNRGWSDRKEVDLKANMRHDYQDKTDEELDAELTALEQEAED